MPKTSAYALLAYHGAKTILRRAVGSPRGLDAFLDNYREDRLPPLTPEELHLLARVDGCLACGLCDTLARPAERDDAAGLPGPSALPSSVSRHPPDYDVLGRFLTRVEAEDLDRMEAICPGRVPLRRLAQLVRDVGARGGHAPGPETKR